MMLCCCLGDVRDPGVGITIIGSPANHAKCLSQPGRVPWSDKLNNHCKPRKQVHILTTFGNIEAAGGPILCLGADDLNNFSITKSLPTTGSRP